MEGLGNWREGETAIVVGSDFVREESIFNKKQVK